MSHFKECLEKCISKNNEIVVKLEDKITELEREERRVRCKFGLLASVASIGDIAVAVASLPLAAPLAIVSQAAQLTIGSQPAQLAIGSLAAPLVIVSRAAQLTIGSQPAQLAIGSLAAPLVIVSRAAQLTIGSQAAQLAIGSLAAPLVIVSRAAQLAVGSLSAQISNLFLYKMDLKKIASEIEEMAQQHKQISNELNVYYENISEIVEKLKKNGVEEEIAVLIALRFISRDHQLTEIEYIQLTAISNSLVKVSGRMTLKSMLASVVGVAFDMVDVVRRRANSTWNLQAIKELIDVLNSQKVKTEKFLRFYKLIEDYDLNFAFTNVAQPSHPSSYFAASDGSRIPVGKGNLEVHNAFDASATLMPSTSTDAPMISNTNIDSKATYSIRGIALLINNYSFTEKRDLSRTSNESSAKLLDTLLKIGYDVTSYTNLSAMEMEEKIKQTCERVTDKHDSIIIGISSHGNEISDGEHVHQVVYGIDCEPVDITDIILKFTSTECPQLRDKVKIFLIDACRGPKDCEDISAKKIFDQLIKRSGAIVTKGDKCSENIIILNATQKGFNSYMGTKDPVLLFSCVADCLNIPEYRCMKPDEFFKIVKEAVEKAAKEQIGKKMEAEVQSDLDDNLEFSFGSPAIPKFSIRNFWFSPEKIEDIEPELIAYRRAKKPVEIKYDITSKEAVNKLNKSGLLVESKRVIFIVHGFRNDRETSWLENMKNTMLRCEDQTVIIVAWGGGANLYPFEYPIAAQNIKPVGEWLAGYAGEIKSSHKMEIWGIGHSLGAHLMGIAGRNSKAFTRITGLDPAGPTFEGDDGDNMLMRLQNDDAQIVDVIHTNGYDSIPSLLKGDMCDEMENKGGFVNHYGTLIPLGTVDFYPNYGHSQTGCCGLNYLKIGCSHNRAIELFIWSISNPGKFKTNLILDGSPDLDKPVDKLKRVPNLMAEMGYHYKAGSSGSPQKHLNYYLKTNAKEPWI